MSIFGSWWIRGNKRRFPLRHTVLILDGNSDHVAPAWRKIRGFGVEKKSWLPSIYSHALNRSNNRDSPLRAPLFQRYHLIEENCVFLYFLERVLDIDACEYINQGRVHVSGGTPVTNQWSLRTPCNLGSTGTPLTSTFGIDNWVGKVKFFTWSVQIPE